MKTPVDPKNGDPKKVGNVNENIVNGSDSGSNNYEEQPATENTTSKEEVEKAVSSEAENFEYKNDGEFDNPSSEAEAEGDPEAFL